MRLGIEIGGTKLQLGVGGGQQAKLVALRRADIDAAAGAEGILRKIARLGGELTSQFDISHVGVGFGGPVDPDLGEVITSHQITGWDHFKLADWLDRQFHVPVTLANDCDAAALAEASFGAGRGRKSVFYVTVGTGVGGGFVQNGRLPGAGRPAVSEIGHLRPGLDCRNAGQTVESLASGRGIEAAMRRQLATLQTQHGSSQPPTDALELLGLRPHGEQLTARDIGQAAAHGNALAADVLADALRTLGWAIAQVITLTAPEVVVVGGGVSLMGEELFFAPLRREVATYVFPPLADSYQLAPAGLGEETVVFGAIALTSL